jgi:putative hemolysin
MLRELLEVLVIFLLILANGMFSMAEIAIISARKARLQQWAEDGNAKARAALELASSPNLFLPTVQIGITLVGVLTGALSGATIAESLTAAFAEIPVLAPYSSTLALATVVLSITYLSLVIGELVPKRLGLNRPEAIASVVAVPMQLLSVIASPVVRLLGISTDLVLKLLRIRPSEELPITEEEIKVLINQGTMAGIFEETEQDMVGRVFRLADRRVGVLMTPRKKVVWLDINDSPDKIRRKITKSKHSRYPVCQARLGNILGVVHVRDLLTRSLAGHRFDLRSALHDALFVHESTHVFKVMEHFKEAGTQIALVIDEYGTIEGLVTLNDVLEAIIGDTRTLGEEEEPKVVERENGTFLVDGMLPVDELKELFHIRSLPGEDEDYFRTLGGFVMTYLKRIPSAGDKFECCGLRFEVLDMDGHRVDKVLIEPDGTGDRGPSPPA